MNIDRDPEAVIAAWLDDGPAQLPTETRHAIAVGIRTVPRRRPGSTGAFSPGIKHAPICARAWYGCNRCGGSRAGADTSIPINRALVDWPLSPSLPRPTLTVPPYGPAGNGVIALAKDGDIVVADWPGGETRPLVAGPELDSSPMFSPDGTRLAFLRSTELGSALMVADADGTNVVQLTPETLDASMWSFAPDGRSLVGVAVIDGEPVGPASEFGNAPYRVLIRPVDPAAALTVLDIRLWDGAMELYQYGGPASARRTPRRSSS